MSSMSIGGLASGLDTAGIISQLMQLEARPQTMLKSRVSNEQKIVTALQALNTKVANIATKAAELAKTDSWSPTKATSSSETVTATTGTNATPGSVTFEAISVAVAYKASYTTTAPAKDPGVVAANSPIQINYDDGRTAVTIDSGDGSLSAIAAALNASDTGVRASLVKVNDTDYRLHVESTTTGSTSGLTLTEADGTTPILGSTFTSTAGADARIRIDGETTDIVSKTNTFKDLMPGVDVTLTSATPLNTPHTVSVEQDPTALAGSVKAMVDLVNGVLSEIKTLTDSDPAAKKKGLLSGDSTMRSLRNQLLESVTHGIDGATLATVGIQVDKTGKLVFDEAKFTEAYTADPTGTTNKLAGTATSDGFMDKVASLAKTFSDSTDGSLTLSIKNRNTQIRGLEDDIAGWDLRLASRREALQRQYTALEVALGSLQSQGNWLSGQLAGLPKWS
jgi:flagellar hook-associated protein 2